MSAHAAGRFRPACTFCPPMSPLSSRNAHEISYSLQRSCRAWLDFWAPARREMLAARSHQPRKREGQRRKGMRPQNKREQSRPAAGEATDTR